MMQQINLYQPIFRKEHKIFSAKTILIGNMIVLTGLIALYGVAYRQGQSLQGQLTQTIQQRDESRIRLTKIKKAYPEKKRDPQLAKRVKEVKVRLDFLKGISTTLTSRSSGNDRGFSEYLAGLSRQDISQLWLEQITILAGGGEIKLKGLTTKSEYVPRYIQQLSHEPVFQGTTFHKISINRQDTQEQEQEQEQGPMLIQFNLETALISDESNLALSSFKKPQGSPKLFNDIGPSQILNRMMR